MKKIAVVIVAMASVFLVAAGPADAGRRVGFHGGSHGHPGFHPGFRTHVVIGPRVWIGSGWGPYWYPPYYYPPVYSPVYTPPVVVEPQTYIQQSSPVANYWYYCESGQAYYPYVQQCPGGWLTVVPPPTTEPTR